MNSNNTINSLNPVRLLLTLLLVSGFVITFFPVWKNLIHACSGLRSLISISTLSVVYGYFTLNSNLLRSILALSGIPAAILVNILRVFIMVLSFYFFNYDLTTGSIHTVFGVFIFFLAILFIIFVKGLIARWERPLIHE